MSEAVSEAPRARLAPILFGVTVFTSATLVFLIQPMVAKLILPQLGGSAAVWNTSMVFYQAALLLGYAYAHALQRVKSLKVQAIIHLCVLLVAALALPLRVTHLLGDPDTAAPIPWLLGVLAITIGAPFAALSATAPLLQAWYARIRAGDADAKNPYVLYAASNLGSFIALLAYPALVEPLLRVSVQTALWSGGYLLFIGLILALAALGWAARSQAAAPPLAQSAPIPWKEKLIWIALAAVPSSLMLGVTTHMVTDIASAPFLWVIPLALYLLTFVLAFQDKPVFPLSVLVLQAALVGACVALAPFNASPLPLLFGVHLATYFFTALMCHQALARRRPPADRLTEFYLLLSVGGVLGGAFNALIAPLIFSTVREYILVLLLATLARPWPRDEAERSDWICFLVVIVMSTLAWSAGPLLQNNPDLVKALAFPGTFFEDPQHYLVPVMFAILGVAVMAGYLLRRRTFLFFISLSVVTLAAHQSAGGYHWIDSERGFFGVLRTANYDSPNYKGDVTMLLHGTTLHGAQAKNAQWLCHPMLYYAESTPLGQAMTTIQNRGPAEIGVVGLGTGALASYRRAADHMTYFEIDPKVLHFARNPARFSYIDKCGAGPVAMVMGDARLTLARQPAGKYDILVIDAFSSDSIPTHLLTEEALRGYLRVLKPNGVVVLHLSNRHLEITTPAVAAVRAIGGAVLTQNYVADRDVVALWESSTDALVFAHTPQALADFAADGRWETPPPTDTKPWTDDYTNLVGALWRHMQAKQAAR
jgi:SAM-dependent methyltransferase